ncbi:MAG: protein-PII uridylyltransferase GlnD [Actinomycetota bacterium]|jgi:[protein-PII] uridylyltransferase
MPTSVPSSMLVQSVAHARSWEVLSDKTDDELRRVFAGAVQQHAPKGCVALLAVGGYGRRELAPFSDLDVLLLHDRKKLEPAFAQALWYPLWDSGHRVGHAVRTPRETVAMVCDDLDTATAIVTARVLAGDAAFGEKVIAKSLTELRRRSREWTRQLHTSVVERHRSAGEVAYLLEPDLKNGLGGLRDIHAMWWARAAGFELSDRDQRDLAECNDVLLRIRVALHRTTGRPGDVLHLQDQSAVACEAGFADDDELMATIASVGRRVMWITDEAWARLDPPVASRSARPLAPGVALVNGEVHLADDADPASDPTLVLRVAAAAARQEARINRDSLDRLGRFSRKWPAPWPTGAQEALVAFLLEGERAIPVWEALEQRDLVSRVLPEWTPVRCRPQRNAFHRFTVDRHLWQSVANASALADQVSRPDLLVIAALFHDLGKGYPGDHTDAGLELFASIGPRMGLSDRDVATTMTLIRHHLLLPDVATRRDVSDDATIDYVSEQVGDTTTLRLLQALTRADALATGPTAWGGWKEELVSTLVARVEARLSGEHVDSSTWRLFPEADTLAMMASGEQDIRVTDDSITVVSPDRPGLFTSVAGVLSVHGLDILSAEAHSDEHGMAASRFHLRTPPLSGWGEVLRDVTATFDGRLDIDARLRDRAATYSRRRRESARGPQPPEVRFDDRASSNATVIEVHAPDRVGLLRDITKVFANEQIDIRHARIATLGDNVVDTFYVREASGELVAGAERRTSLSKLLLKAVS